MKINSSRRKLAFFISLITLGVVIAALVYTSHHMIHKHGSYHSEGAANSYPNESPSKSSEKDPYKAILDSLEVLSPYKDQLVRIAYEKGNRNNAYGMKLGELLKKKGYVNVITFEAHNSKLSEKKVYFTRSDHDNILVYINLY